MELSVSATKAEASVSATKAKTPASARKTATKTPAPKMEAPAPENPYHNTQVPRYVFDPWYLFGKSVPYCHRIRDQVIPVSNYDSGDTIAEVIENIRHLPYEVVVCFDRNHRKIYDFTNYSEVECTISLPVEWKPYLQISIHNHPNSNWQFSVKDFLAMPNIYCPTLVVVCKDYTYVIEHWPRNWASEAPENIRNLDDYRNLVYRYAGNIDLLIDALIGQFRKAGLKTKYTIYDLAGKIVHEIPFASDISRDEHYRRIEAYWHLLYARR